MMKKRMITGILLLSLLCGCAQQGTKAAEEEGTAAVEVPSEAGGTAAESSDTGAEAGGTAAESGDTGAEAGGTEVESSDSGAESGGTVAVPGAGTTNLTEGVDFIPEGSTEPDEEQLGALSGAFLKLFSETLSEAGEENVLISPISVIQAFGMTENGASGETLRQMEDVINGGIAVEEINPILYGMSVRFMNSEEVSWNVANSIWFKDNGRMEIEPDFAAAAAGYYQADLFRAPFDQETVDDINQWVSEETRGMIPGILEDIDEEAQMFLINALAFEGEWNREYEEDDILENERFTNADGNVSDVTMLYSNESSYFTLGDGIGFLRPYRGREYSFFGILPAEGVSVADYVEALAASGQDLSAALRDPLWYSGDIYVMIPEFTLDYAVEMSGILKDLGMTDPFSQTEADFERMMIPVGGSADIWIGAVLHKTHIEVDRKGTRAAAVTAIEMSVNSCIIAEDPPIRIYLDRPFVYGIVDNATGLPVFLGCVNSME